MLRAESEIWGYQLLDLASSGRVKKLCTPEPSIKHSEEYRGYHRYEQKTAMMLGQGETGKR